MVGEGEEAKYTKVPMNPKGFKASSNKSSTWVDYVTARDAYNRGGFDGVGFIFSDIDDIVGIDLDDCRDVETGELTEFAQNIIENIDGYLEVSPSGTGVKLFTRSLIKSAHVDHDIGLEVYARARFFVVTGHKISGSIPAEPQDVSSIVPERNINVDEDPFSSYTPPVDGWTIERVEQELLPELNPDCGYTDWLTVGQALHHQFNGSQEGLDLFDSWSQGSPKYVTSGINTCQKKWASYRGAGVTLRSLIFKVNQIKLKTALENGDIVLDTNNPMQHARQFLDATYAVAEGYKLTHYADDFYIHKGTHYQLIENLTVRSKAYAFLEKCKKQNRQGDLVPFVPNPANVTAMIDAIAAMVHLENDTSTTPPVWLEGYAAKNPPANKLISLQNGLFHLQNEVLLPHSLGFFNLNTLQFAYDPDATCPVWMDFLDQLWEEDPESIELLQEYMGYILTGDNSQQKFLSIIGPRRSGKGSINRVLVELLGQHNTVAPTLEELTDTFGLQSWIGKPLASFTDARAPSRNQSGVVSQLLRIVGNDTITVNRKNREAWNGYLPTRIILYSNEVLQLTENSNALTGRMLFLKMQKTFFGKEDVELSNKLSKELAGIFNWCMAGHKRRLARGGYFIQPKSGQEYLDLTTELGNPMGAFINEALVFEADATTTKDDVFAVYKHWANRRGIHAGNDLTFKRRFVAAVQEHGIQSDTIEVDGDSVQVYKGIKLSRRAQEHIDSISTFDRGSF